MREGPAVTTEDEITELKERIAELERRIRSSRREHLDNSKHRAGRIAIQRGWIVQGWAHIHHDWPDQGMCLLICVPWPCRDALFAKVRCSKLDRRWKSLARQKTQRLPAQVANPVANSLSAKNTCGPDHRRSRMFTANNWRA